MALVGLGQIAREIFACAQAQGHQVVGGVDIDPTKTGRDLGEVLGFPALGLRVAPAVESLEAGTEVALVTTGSQLDKAADQISACIRAGLNVVSTCEELVYPWRTQADIAGFLDDEARSHGVTVVGTGINPGFVMDLLVLALSAPCWQVRAVRVSRVLDAGTRRTSFQEKVGVGLTQPEFVNRVAQQRLGHVGLAQSAWMVADRLTLGGERLDESVEPVLGQDGIVAGMRQTVSLCADREVVRLNMEMSIGAPDPADMVQLDADPQIELVIPGGIPGDAGTAGVVLNGAARVIQAPAGLLTIDQLPIPHCAGSPRRTGVRARGLSRARLPEDR